MARECVRSYYKDSDFRDIVPVSSVKRVEGQKHLCIDGNYGHAVTCSRTSKVTIRDKFKCKSCGLKATHAIIMRNVISNQNAICFVGVKDGKYVPFTKDHIVPKMLGGRDNMNNLQAMCLPCNQDKSHVFEESNQCNKGIITITRDEYNRLMRKQTDFANARSIIKRSVKKLPWYLKLLGADKFIIKRIQNPLRDMGYYGESKPTHLEDKKDDHENE